MMKLIFIFFTFYISLFTFDVFSQSITWQKIYNGPGNMNDVAYDICQSSDGYFYAVGAGTPIPINNGLYVLKLNAYGDTLWTRIIPRKNAFAVTPSPDGGCVVTGWGDSVFTIKFSSSGNLIWQKHYAGGELMECYDIMRTADGKYIVCGSDRRQGSTKGYLLKVDSSGNFIWQRVYPGIANTFFRAIEEANDGGYILAGGVHDSSLDTLKAYLLKTDTAGNVLWARSFSINNGPSTVLLAISKLNNNYIVGGKNDYSFFVKTDLNGNILFTKLFIEYYEYPGSYFLDMKLAGENRFIFTFFGVFTLAEDSTCYAVVTDSIGNTLVRKFFLYGRFPEFNAILPLPSGDIVFAGDVTPPGGQWTDVYLARTDSLLNAPPIGIRPVTSEIPIDFELYQNFPNPFNNKSKIKFQISKLVMVKLAIFDVLGREIEILVNEELQPGTYEILWDAANFPSGVYFLTLYASSSVFVRKMILIK